MLCFADRDLVDDGGFFRIYRRGDTQGAWLTGPIDDERNPVWRAAFDAVSAADGHPRFVVVDASDAVAAASMPYRMQTAQWARRVAVESEGCLLRGSAEAKLGFALRTILRAAGMGNIDLVTDETTAIRVVEGFFAGRWDRPGANDEG